MFLACFRQPFFSTFFKLFFEGQPFSLFKKEQVAAVFAVGLSRATKEVLGETLFGVKRFFKKNTTFFLPKF